MVGIGILRYNLSAAAIQENVRKRQDRKTAWETAGYYRKIVRERACMEINLADKLKSLRKEKGVSQEKLAQYLNVTFQAVSKWENSNTYPDITLLPDIARFFGITIDALLQAEKIDERALYQTYEARACEQYRNGGREGLISLWQEASHKMPNNIEVKEMLMSAYFDADAVKYQKEIIELGTEICNSDAGSYYKGQAIDQIARTYGECGDGHMAELWARKAGRIMHCQEMILMQVLTDGKKLTEVFSYANYWFLNQLCYMAMGLCGNSDIPGGTAYAQEVERAVIKLYEVVYPGDDMGFEDLRLMCMMHCFAAEDELSLGRDEAAVKYELTRALECAQKSISVEAHDLSHPLVKNWHVMAAPTDRKQIVRFMKGRLEEGCFDSCREREWFHQMRLKIETLLY